MFWGVWGAIQARFPSLLGALLPSQGHRQHHRFLSAHDCHDLDSPATSRLTHLLVRALRRRGPSFACPFSPAPAFRLSGSLTHCPPAGLWPGGGTWHRTSVHVDGSFHELHWHKGASYSSVKLLLLPPFAACCTAGQ